MVLPKIEFMGCRISIFLYYIYIIVQTRSVLQHVISFSNFFLTSLNNRTRSDIDPYLFYSTRLKP